MSLLPRLPRLQCWHYSFYPVAIAAITKLPDYLFRRRMVTVVAVRWGRRLLGRRAKAAETWSLDPRNRVAPVTRTFTPRRGIDAKAPLAIGSAAEEIWMLELIAPTTPLHLKRPFGPKSAYRSFWSSSIEAAQFRL